MKAMTQAANPKSQASVAHRSFVAWRGTGAMTLNPHPGPLPPTALERQLTLARAVAPAADTDQRIEYKKRHSDNATIIGTTDQFLYTSSFTIAQGRFLSAAEVEGGRPVCVIGFQVATNLFQGESPIGNKVMIGPRAFEVLGVLEKQGGFLDGGSLDNQAIVPLNQFVTVFWSHPA